MRLSAVFVALILVTGGCEGESTNAPALVVSTTSIDFGDVNVGLTGVEEFTLTNTGGGEIELFTLNLLEGAAANWVIERDPAERLAAGESLTVTVTFVPLEQRTELARIQIRSNDPAEASKFVLLEGAGGPSVADLDEDGYSEADGDCNDNEAAAYPGADEICDGIDNDCDGELLPEELDEDNDGFALCDGDCNDADPDIYPGAPEICDGEDSDCDGTNADYEDNDDDSFTPCQGDCDDFEPLATPDGVEICDGIDNDCSLVIDDLDLDGDGHSPCFGGDCDDGDPFAYPVVVDAAAGGGGDGSDEFPFDNLGTALENLNEGCHSVSLVPGTYTFSGTVDGIEVTIVGQDRDTVLVIPPDGQRFFEVVGGGHLTVANLTLQSDPNGAAVPGDGGALSAVASDLTIDNVLIEGFMSTGDGGAVAVFSGDLVLDRVQFLNNVAGDDGGALSMLGGSMTDVEGSTYVGNSAARGGAALIDGSLLTMSDAILEANVASADGGALMLIATPVLQVERLTLWSNEAGLSGGAMALTNVQDASGYIRNCWVQDNLSDGVGGGLYVGGNLASFVLANNTFAGNTADSIGGGIYVDADDSSGVFAAANLVTWSTAQSGFEVRDGVGGTYAWNTAFATSAIDADFVGIPVGEDDNTSVNPSYADYLHDDDPTNDDLTLDPSSPAVDSGPPELEGPDGYQDWADLDGSDNDRGATGGPGA
jgi:hypothetical protein